MLDTFNKGIILKKMPPPHMHTLFVELVQVQPGSDGGPCSNGSITAPVHRNQMINHHPPPTRSQLGNGSSMASFSATHPQPFVGAPHSQPMPAIQQHNPASVFNTSIATPTAAYAPPPPPWSRWGTMSTPAMPPSTQRRNGNGDGSRSNGTPQPSGSRKRKHVDESVPPPSQAPPPQQQQQQQQQTQQQQRPPPSQQQQQQHPADEDPRQSGSSFPMKRHAGATVTPTPTMTPLSPPRPIQTLSPSLAMIVSPTNQEVHTSASSAAAAAAAANQNQLAPLRNGASGSPALPPVKSLISGEPL